MKIQIAIFFVVGFMAWDGIKNAVSIAEASAAAEILVQLDIAQLKEIRVDI